MAAEGSALCIAPAGTTDPKKDQLTVATSRTTADAGAVPSGAEAAEAAGAGPAGPNGAGVTVAGGDAGAAGDAGMPTAVGLATGGGDVGTSAAVTMAAVGSAMGITEADLPDPMGGLLSVATSGTAADADTLATCAEAGDASGAAAHGAGLTGEGGAADTEGEALVQIVEAATPSCSVPWEFILRKYLLVLAMLVVTVTYAAAVNPPGGVWQETDANVRGGEPIFRSTHYRRYLIFFYWNATACITSLVIIALILQMGVSDVVLLRAVMLLDLVSLMAAYVAGISPNKIPTVYATVLMSAVLMYIVIQEVLALWFPDKIAGSDSGGTVLGRNDRPGGPDGVLEIVEEEERDEAPRRLKAEERLRKVLMLLASFAVSITYVAGLSTPGGFWDSTGAGHRPGDAILHGVRLTVFFLCNTTVLVSSLLTIMLLIIEKNHPVLSLKLYGCIVAVLLGLFGAYTAVGCRNVDTTVYVVSLVGALLMYIEFHLSVLGPAMKAKGNHLWTGIQRLYSSASKWFQERTTSDHGRSRWHWQLYRSRSLVLLLATFTATNTYTAGLEPPGGVWQDKRVGHMAGDPIFVTSQAKRYKAFYYCNSVAFVASIVSIIIVQIELLVNQHALEVAMILELLGLMGAYAAGTWYDANTSIYSMALPGPVLIYVVTHITFFTLGNIPAQSTRESYKLVEQRRKLLLLLAIFDATFTYHVGISPPGGFLRQNDKSGHRAGDPVLMCKFPRRYMAFFYCNSVSFFVSLALIILLLNPHLYGPGIRSTALSICTAVGWFCLMGAYAAAGSTQLVVLTLVPGLLLLVVLVAGVLLLVVSLVRRLKKISGTPVEICSSRTDIEDDERKRHGTRKYLMLLGIQLASVTYKACLEPPGGVWHTSGDGYEAGNPVMHDNRRLRYLAFFYSNSISFLASIVVIVLLLTKTMQETDGWRTVMNTTILLDLVTILGAYIAGSSRGWRMSASIVALFIGVLSIIAIPMVLSFSSSRSRSHATQQEELQAGQENPTQSQGQEDGGHQAPRLSEL